VSTPQELREIPVADLTQAQLWEADIRVTEDAAGALDGFRRPRTIPAAGSGNPPLSLLKHPARGFALVSTPWAGLVSPAMTRRSCTDEH